MSLVRIPYFRVYCEGSYRVATQIKNWNLAMLSQLVKVLPLSLVTPLQLMEGQDMD